MEKIKLSVILISYNQEEYIRQAIDSILSQKIDFSYEVILADDCSPDNTKQIFNEYKEKNKDLIRVLDRKNNLGATKNILDAASNSRGEYIVVLEGDDYWIDNEKLQKQMNFLTSNPDYIGVSHLQEGRLKTNEFVNNFPLWVKNDTTVTMKDFTKNKDFSFSTCMYKNIYIDDKYKDDISYLLSLHRIVGDLQICFYLLSIGKVYIINEPMMVYRILKDPKENNYNSKNSIDKIVLENEKIIRKIDDHYNYKYNFFWRYSEYITVGICISIIKLKFKNILQFLKYCPIRYVFLIILILPYSVAKILLRRLRRSANE